MVTEGNSSLRRKRSRGPTTEQKLSMAKMNHSRTGDALTEANYRFINLATEIGRVEGYLRQLRSDAEKKQKEVEYTVQELSEIKAEIVATTKQLQDVEEKYESVKLNRDELNVNKRNLESEIRRLKGGCTFMDKSPFSL